MKNILIPTTFESDTLQALKMSSRFKQNEEVNITLLSASALGNSIIDRLFLSNTNSPDPAKRQQVLDAWSVYQSQNNIHSCTNEHHQYGVSRPVFRQVMKRFSIDMAIVPLSYQQSKIYTDRILMSFLHDSKIPLMLLPAEQQEEQDIHRALFIEDESIVTSPVIETLPFHVIRQSMIQTAGLQSMKAIVQNFRINMIVLAKSNARQLNQTLSDLGLPVLTV